jgi:hypothetical protein
MNEEETRPTEGYLKCSPEVSREIEAALRLKEIDKIVRPLIESATPSNGGQETHEE